MVGWILARGCFGRARGDRASLFLDLQPFSYTSGFNLAILRFVRFFGIFRSHIIRTLTSHTSHVQSSIFPRSYGH
jgi:hypothetical protein